MKATFISKEKNDVTFKMEFTAEELEQAVIKSYQANKDQFQVDGFRKGKAPRSIIEKKYGENVFVEDAVNDLINGGYPQALTQLDLRVIDSPRVEFSNYKKGDDFTATVTVTVYPEIEVKDYKGVTIDKIEAELTDEEVDKELEAMQKRNGRMVVVERPVADGDTVLLDYKGFVGDEQFEGGTAEKFPLKIGSGSFIPGFEDQLIGAETGGDVEVKVTFPEEYHSESLAGKEAVFKCHVIEIKEEELPELDDEFAKDVSEFDTLEELKKDTADNLRKSKEAQVENKMKDNVLEKVYNANEIDIPDVMVDDEINNMMNEFDQQLKAQGMDLQKYFTYLKKDPKEFRDEIKDDAYKRVKTRMVVSAVAEAEKLEASDEDLEKEIELMAIQYQMEADKIKEMLGMENLGFLKQDIKMRKAVDFMYENAEIK
ncbi:MAG: trigger factor [Anaerovoracaceae bacterium]|jgi:trigger factor